MSLFLEQANMIEQQDGFYKFATFRLLHYGLLEIRFNSNNEKIVWDLADVLHNLPLDLFNGDELDYKVKIEELKVRFKNRKLLNWFEGYLEQTRLIYEDMT